MLTGVENFIKNIERKDKIITYLKNIYKIEVGDEAIVPNAYIDGVEKNEEVEKTQKEFSSFEDKVIALNLPIVNDKNMKLKIAKLKKAKDTTFLIKNLDISNYGDHGMNLTLFKRVLEGLKIIRSVEVLNLRKNNIDDTYIDSICELFNIETIKRIDLSYNNLTKSSNKKLLPNLKTTTRLEYLDLSYNPLTQDEYTCISICLALKTYPGLYHFGICDTSRDSAVKLLQAKPEIRSLNLDDSRYKIKTFELLFKCLSDKRYSLAVLTLRYTYIDLFTANFIEKSLRLNKSLVFLNLYSSGISDIAAARIISGLDQNKTLIEIDLGANRLSDNFCKAFNKILKINNIIAKVNLTKNYLINNENFQVILDGLVNNQSIISLGDLYELKIGVKIRESAEIILDLNNKFLSSNNINNLANSLEMNRSQKMNFFKSSIDFECFEKIKRESLDIKGTNKIDDNTYTTHEEEVINKYDIKLHSNDENDYEFFIY